MKLYYTFNQLKADLPYLKDVEIKVANDFDRTIDLDTFRYKSLMKQVKRQNIKITVESRDEKLERNKWKYYHRNKGGIWKKSKY